MRFRLDWERVEDRTLLSPTLYTVNLATDNGPTLAGTGSGTTGDLRYVINLADADPNPDGSLIVFDPTVFGTAQTIPLSPSLGTLNLLETLRARGSRATVVIACSSAEYGEVAGQGRPVGETDPLLPVSPYGLSKLDQDMLGYLYSRTHGLRVIRARIFNTIGPRKQGDFLADFCQQIAAIESGKAEPLLRTGELNSRRDLSDVRDTVAALDLLSARGASGEVYNICSGQTVRIGDVVKLLLEVAGCDIEHQVEACRLRPFEESIIWGDNRKLVACTGWSPRTPLHQTVKDTLDYWREQARESNLGYDRSLNARIG